MKTVLIETPATDGQTEWGVSFGCANPLPSEYVACKTKDDAVRLGEKMDKMLSTLAERERAREGAITVLRPNQ